MAVSGWRWILRILLLLATIWVTLLIGNRARAYHPPTPEKCLQALGSLTEDVPDRSFFVATEGFTLLGPAKAGEWLSIFPEPGQGFDAYVRSDPLLATGSRRTMYLQPIGRFDAGSSPSLEQLSRFMQAFFQLPVGLLPEMTLDGTGVQTRHPQGFPQRQILSGDLLNLLKRRLPADAYCLEGVTMEDLWPGQGWNFVFGEATLSDRVGVFSCTRYDERFYGREPGPDAESILLKRSCKVLAHEAGHMFGLLHCTFYHCLMNGSNHLAEADSRPIHLCPVCLRKMSHGVPGFRVDNHYRDLTAFFQEVGWQAEKDWVEARRKNR